MQGTVYINIIIQLPANKQVNCNNVQVEKGTERYSMFNIYFIRQHKPFIRLNNKPNLYGQLKEVT